MRSILAAAVLATACGGARPVPATAQTPATPAPRPATSAAQAAAPAVTPEAICARFQQLRAEPCGGLASMQLDASSCVDTFRKGLAEPERADGKVLAAMGRCMVEHAACADVLACLGTITYEDPHDLRACTDDADSRAVGVPAAEFAQRNGAGVTRFRDAHSSKAQPIEMCGIDGGIDWLESLTCDDGSHPVTSHGRAEALRAGNVGPGGRCGSIIDLYRVPCPEATYDVYVDGYICALPR